MNREAKHRVMRRVRSRAWARFMDQVGLDAYMRHGQSLRPMDPREVAVRVREQAQEEAGQA